MKIAKDIVALMRPDQWVKNCFVLAPLLFAPWAVSAETLAHSAAAFGIFCLWASAVYALNDTLDRKTDLLHPVKRSRPMAAGRLAPWQGFGLSAGLAAAGSAAALALNPQLALIGALYLGLNLAYCLIVKHIAIVDVLFVAIGFVLRVQAGGEAIGIEPSPWIMIGTGLAATFLALAKRRDDLVQALEGNHRASLDGYNKPFLDAALLIVMAGGLLCYLLYTTDATIAARLATDKLYYTVPFVTAGVLRYLQVIYVFEQSGSPTRTLLSDRFLQLCLLGWLGSFVATVYL